MNKYDAAREVFEEHLREVSKRASYRLAQRAAGKLRQVVLDQLYDWVPLTPKYLRTKERKGLDTRVLRATGEYVASIVPRWSEEKQAYVISAADRPHAGAKGISPPSLQQIGEWLEFGTRNADGSVRMPARPHWRPFSEWVTTQAPSWQAEFEETVWAELEPRLRAKLQELA